MPSQVKCSVVFHSNYGHTKKQAESIAQGMNQVTNGNCKLVDIAKEIDWDWIDSSSVIAMGCPTYMGSVSAEFKTFMDATSKRWLDRKWHNKIAGGFTNSAGYSGDKLSTLIQICIFASQHGMIWVGVDTPPHHHSNGLILNRLSCSLGATAMSENAPADITPPLDDLETARLYGIRLAEKGLSLAL